MIFPRLHLGTGICNPFVFLMLHLVYIINNFSDMAFIQVHNGVLSMLSNNNVSLSHKMLCIGQPHLFTATATLT